MYQRVSRERVTVMTGRSGPVCGAEAMLCALWSCGKRKAVGVWSLSSLSHTRDTERRLASAWRLSHLDLLALGTTHSTHTLSHSTQCPKCHEMRGMSIYIQHAPADACAGPRNVLGQ